jgi:hypothetical protein
VGRKVKAVHAFRQSLDGPRCPGWLIPARPSRRLIRTFQIHRPQTP